jgi:hypothetical protein
MKRIILQAVLLLISSVAYAQLPGSPAIWLRADSGVTLTNNAVSTWADVSGNGNNVTQTTTNLRPYLQRNVFNGKPALF